jgi:hypothetical protein
MAAISSSGIDGPRCAPRIAEQREELYRAILGARRGVFDRIAATGASRRPARSSSALRAE